jgi:hypothetical protein
LVVSKVLLVGLGTETNINTDTYKNTTHTNTHTHTNTNTHTHTHTHETGGQLHRCVGGGVMSPIVAEKARARWKEVTGCRWCYEKQRAKA